MQENVIEFKKVWKKFKRGRKLLLKEALLDVFKPASTESFWVLKDVSFSLAKGEALGIIGSNGSGKSTILKLIAGVMTPTQGKIITTAKIAPLIELGAGFHPQLSGRENVYLNATILGLSRKEIDEKFDSIVKFAELEDFIDTPVKHYSSGMYMRLGFSIAIHIDPEILLVDEILAVGDEKFQRKSFMKMKSFKNRETSIVFVSHNLNAVQAFCDRVIYLKDGTIKYNGDPKEAVKMYLSDNNVKRHLNMGKFLYKFD